MNWTHAICQRCWFEQYPDRDPARFLAHAHLEETCCFCGKATQSGIYVRRNPADPTLICSHARMPREATP